MLINYQNSGVTRRKCEDIGAGNDVRTRGFELSLGVVDDVVAVDTAVWTGGLLGPGTLDEDRAVAALDEAIVEVKPDQTRGDSRVCSKMSRDRCCNDGFGVRARGRVETDTCPLAVNRGGEEKKKHHPY